MKTLKCILLFWISFMLLTISCQNGEKAAITSGKIPPGLTGDYLGQAVPGDSAVLFAPGIISTGLANRDVAISPDGNEIYFGVTLGTYSSTIAVCKRINGTWTGPEIAGFCKDPKIMYFEPCLSWDGDRLYFLSNLVDSDGVTGDQDIWYVERQGSEWSHPINPGPPVNSDGAEYFPSLTRNGDMYFSRAERGSRLNMIYRSRWTGDAFQEAELLPEQVNCGTNRFNAFVSHGEDYMIIPAMGIEDSYGGVDYYITFRDESDRWSEPMNMGPTVNSEAMGEWSPYVSRDGKFLFFMSNRTIIPEGDWNFERLTSMHGKPGNGNSDIYWIDAGVIAELKKKAEFS